MKYTTLLIAFFLVSTSAFSQISEYSRVIPLTPPSNASAKAFADAMSSYGQRSRNNMCVSLMETLKSVANGTTYTSYNSTAISRVTFYDVEIDYKPVYYAIVCFTYRNAALGCAEYIYRVSSDTERNYSLNYMNSAGQAFNRYIKPYNKNLYCGVE